jgi:hypothetical protein
MATVFVEQEKLGLGYSDNIIFGDLLRFYD